MAHRRRIRRMNEQTAERKSVPVFAAISRRKDFVSCDVGLTCYQCQGNHSAVPSFMTEPYCVTL